MERLTKISKAGNAYYPKCFEEPCCGMGECLDDNCSLILDVCKKLAEYEQLEEQGLLVKLPVKIETELFQPCADRKSIIRSIVINNTITDDDIYIGIIDERGNERHYSKKSIGKTVFLTREEAEKKLEEMKTND